MKVEDVKLLHRLDKLRSDWWLWECSATLEDGTIVEGTVEANSQGSVVSKETFEQE